MNTFLAAASNEVEVDLLLVLVLVLWNANPDALFLILLGEGKDVNAEALVIRKVRRMFLLQIMLSVLNV